MIYCFQSFNQRIDQIFQSPTKSVPIGEGPHFEPFKVFFECFLLLIDKHDEHWTWTCYIFLMYGECWFPIKCIVPSSFIKSILLPVCTHLHKIKGKRQHCVGVVHTWVLNSSLIRVSENSINIREREDFSLDNRVLKWDVFFAKKMLTTSRRLSN